MPTQDVICHPLTFDDKCDLLANNQGFHSTDPVLAQLKRMCQTTIKWVNFAYSPYCYLH